MQAVELPTLGLDIPSGYTHRVRKKTGVGANIEQRREALGMTQVALAQRLGVAQSVVNKVEHQADAKANTLLSYAKALNCSVEDLLSGIDADYDARRTRAEAAHLQKLDAVTTPVTAADVDSPRPRDLGGEPRGRDSTISAERMYAFIDQLRKNAGELSKLADSVLRESLDTRAPLPQRDKSRKTAASRGGSRVGARPRHHRGAKQ